MQGSPVCGKNEVFGMMYRVVGIRKNMSFNTKDGGKMSGLKLHLLCPDDHVEGMASDSFFISSSASCYGVAASLCPDDDIEIYFNRFGKIDSICKR